MKVLVTGQLGYLGAPPVPAPHAAGHAAVGLDAGFYAGCDFGPPPADIPAWPRDLRDSLPPELFEGVDAVAHFAALSNDPLGDLAPGLTEAINHEATVRLARSAREAGVRRFVFASSCSLYGVADTASLLDETAPFNPVTAYGRSKVDAERDLLALSTDRFAPILLRNATAYGPSPRLRLDVVVNDLVAHAVTTGEILVLSDGTPWRPLVHVDDIARATVGVLEAPSELVHGQAFNVCATRENYQVRDIVARVRRAVPGCSVRYAEGAGPDPRTYRVSGDRLERVVPSAAPIRTLDGGIRDLVDAFVTHGLTREDLEGDRYVRLRRIRHLREGGRLDESLHWDAMVEGAA